MKKFISLAIMLTAAATMAVAQPPVRRNAPKAQPKNAASQNVTTRAQISFPNAPEMKEDVTWRRDIYRELNLMEGKNSGLYYPVEPIGSQMNLFTYLFKLVLSGQVKAYEYRMDGNESFEADHVVKPLNLLDDHGIYYEKKDGRLKLNNADIPSADVKSYYIKESAYYDQVSATYHTKVVALCPVLYRMDDFGDGASKSPLFWVKYDDCAPFLTKQTIMTSDINNAATMSMDDYFVKNMYSGKIYKTNNMLGKTLAASLPDDEAAADSIMKAEQKKIEGELKAFEENIWGDKARKDSLDSIAKVEAATPKAKKAKAPAGNRRSTSGGEAKVSKKTAAPKNSSSGSSAPRVSVRRQRH